MSVSDPSIVDQLREAAEACEKAGAEQMEKARRFRDALAALEGPAPLPATTFPAGGPWPPGWFPPPPPNLNGGCPVWIGDTLPGWPLITWGASA